MTLKAKLTLVYGSVAVICGGIVGTTVWLMGKGRAPKAPLTELVQDTGKETMAAWLPVEGDLEGINQTGAKVKLSDLKGKVVVVAEFFAMCPKCAQRNGSELSALHELYRNNPDFHIICVSIDPGADSQEKLKEYGINLGADPKNWWFFNAGDEKATHEFLEQKLKFMAARERPPGIDRDSNGRFMHDMAFTLINRDWQIVGKWNVADAASDEGKKLDPGGYERLKGDLHGRIKTELAAKPSTAGR